MLAMSISATVAFIAPGDVYNSLYCAKPL
ncbi:hypothetical protein CGRA01v4_14165 [Colletotrichum graminicola]|nr:hypothetical protein CGRA01v4_14165 [Colletotrichum graminicola]